MSSYAHVIGGDAKFAGVDQGIDFVGAGPVYAQDLGVVTRRVSSGSGWPGEGAVLVYKLKAGPAAGQSIYVAEDFKAAPGIGVGSIVRKGQIIGYATGSGKAPGIETGWATDAGLPLAPRPPARPAPQTTPEGQSFLAFVTGKSSSSSSGGGGVVSAIGDAAGTAAHVAGDVAGVAGKVVGLASDPAGTAAGFFLDKTGVKDWVKGTAGYAAVYLMLVLFSIVLGLLGVLSLLGIRPGTVIAGGRLAAMAAA